MKSGPLQLVLAVIFAGAALAVSEWRLPVRQSLEADAAGLIGSLARTRARILRLEVGMPSTRRDIQNLRLSVDALGDSLERSVTDELYISVNPGKNHLYLRRGRKLLLDARISTGRNETLTSGRKKWVFETPRGIMTVIRKKKAPVWIKPDWAFVEKGESIPSWESPLRLEQGVLGNYMLDLGGGVMIHGTPQEHLLGRSVTHGCVRVGSEDLKVLYDSTPVGTKVFIY
jgi:L,D-transpeptidase ErfK/SrfK